MSSRPVLNGHRVVDDQLEAIGKVTDVLYDDRNMEPRWAIVKTGLLGGEHLVPLARTYLDAQERLVVPFDKTSVKRAPRIGRDHVFTPETEREVRDFYGIAV